MLKFFLDIPSHFMMKLIKEKFHFFTVAIIYEFAAGQGVGRN
jgi:hypothetical protein